MPEPAAKPPAVRLRQGLALLAGAGAIELLVGVGPLDFFWTPLLVGLAYLLAAALGGRANGHWATAVVLVAFGAVVVLLHDVNTGINLPAGYLLAVGLGGMAAAALAPRGFSVDALGVAGAIAAAGLFLFLVDEYPNVLGRAAAYAVLLALVGATNVALAGRGREAAASSASS